MLKGKHIILGITGSIAAYKAAYLLRLLIKQGAEVQVVMTPSGKEFITPVTLSSLSGKPVVSEFFTANTGEEVTFIITSLKSKSERGSSVRRMSNPMMQQLLSGLARMIACVVFGSAAFRTGVE